MSMEEALLRLSRAIDSQGEATAVREIIRQRDEAQRQLADMTTKRDFWQAQSADNNRRGQAKDRRIAALQGVITRMKRKAKK